MWYIIVLLQADHRSSCRWWRCSPQRAAQQPEKLRLEAIASGDLWQGGGQASQSKTVQRGLQVFLLKHSPKTKPNACFRNNRIKTKVIQDDVSKFLPPGFKAPVEEQSLSINKIFPSVKPTEAVGKDFKTSKVSNSFAFNRC